MGFNGNNSFGFGGGGGSGGSGGGSALNNFQIVGTPGQTTIDLSAVTQIITAPANYTYDSGTKIITFNSTIEGLRVGVLFLS